MNEAIICILFAVFEDLIMIKTDIFILNYYWALSMRELEAAEVHLPAKGVSIEKEDRIIIIKSSPYKVILQVYT